MNIPVEKLEPGMRLAKDIMNDSGMVLIGRSTVLTPELITRLNNMNIETVSIITSAQSIMPKDQAIAEIEARFKKTEGDPIMDKLKRLFEERIEEVYNAPQ